MFYVWAKKSYVLCEIPFRSIDFAPHIFNANCVMQFITIHFNCQMRFSDPCAITEEEHVVSTTEA